jgi:RNA 2',3'-cyclic 3'-phosphodiesterase
LVASARLFAALDLPVAVRERLAALVPEWPQLRPVPVDALHVTLVFIGHRDEEEIPAIAAAVRETVRGLRAAALRAAAVVPVPPRGPARLFALDLHDEGGQATAIQTAVSAALEPWYEPEERPFWPHVTLARVRKGERLGRLEAEVPPEEFEASEVMLYRSRLSLRGASYEALERVEMQRAAP